MGRSDYDEGYRAGLRAASRCPHFAPISRFCGYNDRFVDDDEEFSDGPVAKLCKDQRREISELRVELAELREMLRLREPPAGSL